MDLKQIRELMNLMGKTGTRRLAIKQGEFEIELEREFRGSASFQDVENESDNPMKTELDQHRAHVSPSKSEETTLVKELEGSYVTSPMVGTFYISPSADDPPFVKVGDQVKAGDVVCIIEAMKVMNEVKAETSGKLERILVKNGDPVEFKSKLFELV